MSAHFRGAHAARVLVSAFCGDELLANVEPQEVVSFEKIREDRMPSPARFKRAIPGNRSPRQIA